MLDLHVRHLDTPGGGLLVEDGLDVGIKPLPLRQHIVQLVLAQYRAQRRLRQLAGGLKEVLYLDDGTFRVDHPEIQHRVHLHRHVVA